MTTKSINNKLLMENMLDKSQESFLMAIELFNKPTSSLCTDGFVIFICNAWELLFKAALLSQNKSIFYSRKGKRTNVTYSLSHMIGLFMTNDKDPARINLEIVLGIRNKAAHLIIPEYSTEFYGIFLACCKNYVSKLEQLFDISINSKLKTNFLSMSIPSSNSTIDVIGKYGKIIGKQFNNLSKFVNKTLIASSNAGTIPMGLSVSYNMTFKAVSSIEKANLTMSKYKQNPDVEYVEIIKTLDANETHPLSRKKILALINDELTSSNIKFVPYTLSKNEKFTSDTFNLYVKEFKIKDNPEYTYIHSINNSTQYTYSVKLVEKIISDITDDSEIFIKIKQKKN